MYEIPNGAGSTLDYESAVFVLKSISDDTSRPFMCVVHVEESGEGSRLVCTDGRRLHYADISLTIPAGDYMPVATKEGIFLKGPDTEGLFPNWKRVIPENGKERGFINLERTSTGKNIACCGSFSKVFAELIEKTGEVVNFRYLDDLPKKEWQIITFEEKNRPLVLRRTIAGKESVAVIMPMSMAA